LIAQHGSAGEAILRRNRELVARADALIASIDAELYGDAIDLDAIVAVCHGHVEASQRRALADVDCALERVALKLKGAA
jgi:hypothetical protein